MKQDKRRQFIRDVLTRHRSLLDLDKAIELLKDEPEARVRRLRSGAIVNIDDVAAYSRLLQQEFPQLVYFFANYKTGTPTPDKFSDDVPIRLFASLEDAVRASLDVEAERPAYNGPNFNRPDVFVRWPWPEELAANDPEKLIGGREFPDDVFRLAIQYRDLGRWFSFRYVTKAYLDPRLPDRDYAPPIKGISKFPLEAYPDLTVLGNIESEFFALYDLNDLETMAFSKRAHALWRRISTKNVALYDPITREIAAIDENNWTRAVPMEPGPLSRALGVVPRFAPNMPAPDQTKWTHHSSVGKQALAGALELPPRYAAFAFTPADGKSEGPALMIGPRPAARKRNA